MPLLCKMHIFSLCEYMYMYMVIFIYFLNQFKSIEILKENNSY